ncbi:hypothetical protein TGPRC2_286760 [Toxoplasma gondii TgCatPRC2]|uniref:Uncharacterized protein n=1 Tax=Toxoplasma gondii TgCatPRC2 TaxID=1130821 RepID=A0A151HHP8_TOXGO|nr:hypothetical protein TGPRC2_286760 [Toxoplasma gondii TgCatPRC2]
MSAAMAASPAVASATDALCHPHRRCSGAAGASSVKKKRETAALSLFQWATALSEQAAGESASRVHKENAAPFESSLLQPFFPPQVFRSFSKRMSVSKASEVDSMPPLKKARNQSSSSPRLARAASRLGTSKAAHVAKAGGREKRTENICALEQPEFLETHDEVRPQTLLSPSEESELASAESHMKGWVLSVAAAVWEVRGSRLSEAYERELMNLYDRPACGTTGVRAYLNVGERDACAALHQEVLRLEQRANAEAELQREYLTQVHQEHVKSLQRLRTALLSRQREMRATLQQLAAVHHPQKRVAEKGRAGTELVDRLRELMDEQERRVTSVYVQQVNRLQESLNELLTKRTDREGNSLSAQNSQKTARTCANGLSVQDSAESGAALSSAALQSKLSDKRGKRQKLSSPFCNSNSSLKRRSVCMLRGLACVTRADAATAKKSGTSKRMLR